MQAGEEKNENRSDCTEGLDDEAARLCGSCAAKQDCDPEMSLPLVNSPRPGLCGDEGAEKE